MHEQQIKALGTQLVDIKKKKFVFYIKKLHIFIKGMAGWVSRRTSKSKQIEPELTSEKELRNSLRPYQQLVHDNNNDKKWHSFGDDPQFLVDKSMGNWYIVPTVGDLVKR